MARFTCNVISYTLHRTVDLTVIIPTPTIPESFGMTGTQAPSHKPAAKYPVLYLLHGYGNNQAQWTGYTNAELYAEERQIAVVMFSGENKFYVNQENGDNYFDFISRELPEFICNMFPVSERREDTFIAGLSMGGFGATVHALTHPEHYAAIGSFSAAYHANPNGIIGGGEFILKPEHDVYQLADKLVKEHRAFPKMYICCGEKDFIYDIDKKFADAMKEMGQEVTWVSSPGYSHEWRYWDKAIEEFLDWLPRTDAYANQKRQI